MGKKFRASRGIIFLVILTLFLTGCVVRMLDFTVISSKNVEMKIKDTAKGTRVTGEDMTMSILGIPLGAPNLKEAVDMAIESAGPGYDALVDGVIYRIYQFYIVFSKSGYKVEGTPVKTREIITQLENNDGDQEISINGLLYHSSTRKDNTQAIKEIGIKKIKANK